MLFCHISLFFCPCRVFCVYCKVISVEKITVQTVNFIVFRAFNMGLKMQTEKGGVIGMRKEALVVGEKTTNPTFTHPTTTLLPSFTHPLSTLCRPCFRKGMWYKKTVRKRQVQEWLSIYPLVTLYLTFSYSLVTFYLPFTYPCFGKVLWYKRKEANGAEKARRENYESYLYLPFTLPLSTLNLTFTYPLPTPVWER